MKPLLTPGCYVLAGVIPLCRPACIYRIDAVGDAEVAVTVVHAPGAPAQVGRAITWPRYNLTAAWRQGDVRVVRRWQAPADTIYAALDRHMDRPARRPARTVRRRKEAA